MDFGTMRITVHRFRQGPTGPEWTWRARQAQGDGRRANVTLKNPLTGTSWFPERDWRHRKELVHRAAAELEDADLHRSSRSDRWAIETVGDLVSAWLTEQKGRCSGDNPTLSEATWKGYEYSARRIADPRYGLALMEPTRVDVTVMGRYRNTCLKQAGISPRRFNQDMKALKLAWKWGRACHYIPERHTFPKVLAKVDPKVFVNCHHTPEEDDILAVLADLKHRDYEVWLACWLLHVTGARIGEVVALRACDLDAATMVVTYGVGGPGGKKTGKRLVPIAGLTDLPDEPKEALRIRAESNDLGPLLGLAKDGRQQVQGFIKRSCARLGISRFTPHGLRRAFIERALDAGMEPGTVAALSGHDPVTMYRYYKNRDPSTTKLQAALIAAARMPRATQAHVRTLTTPLAENQKTGTKPGYKRPAASHSGHTSVVIAA